MHFPHKNIDGSELLRKKALNLTPRENDDQG
jgi:hypothetical protein